MIDGREGQSNIVERCDGRGSDGCDGREGCDGTTTNTQAY